MAQRRAQCSRIDPAEIAASTPSAIKPEPALSWFTSILSLVVPGVLLALLVGCFWRPLGYVGVALVIALTVYYARPVSTFWHRYFEEQRFEGMRNSVRHFKGVRGRRSQVQGIKANTWVCLARDYEEHRKEYRRSNARNAPDPDVKYSLVMAAGSKEGNSREIAFTDGESLAWHPQSVTIESPVSLQKHRDATYLGQGAASAAGCTLEAIVTALTQQGEGMPTSVVARHPLVECYSTDLVVHAIHSGLMWGLIGTDTEGATGIYISARDSTDPWNKEFGAIVVYLTLCGATWGKCGAEARMYRQHAARRKRGMDPEGPQQTFHFHGPVHSMNIARDVESQTANTYEAGRDDLILDALRGLLTAPDIPWQLPPLADLRPQFECAVHDRDINDYRLKPAVKTVLRVCENLSLGVLSSGLFELLRRFVS